MIEFNFTNRLAIVFGESNPISHSLIEKLIQLECKVVFSDQEFSPENIRLLDRADILINNNNYRMNLSDHALMIKTISTIMKRNDFGRILNIFSMKESSLLRESLEDSIYQAGMLALVRSAAIDLAKDQILINSLSSGPVVSNKSEDDSSLFEKIPLRRLITPLEITNFALFLVSDLNTYMTGQNVILDGGVAIQ